jgi:hypothetical protein
MASIQIIDAAGAGYQPAACNIGPAEIAARRRSGHVGVVASLALLGVLVVIGTPPAWRLLVALPAAGAAAGYLQAALRFCAAYGWAGVLNLSDRLRDVQRVPDAAARRAARRRALRLGAISTLVGLAAGLAAVVLPV